MQFSPRKLRERGSYRASAIKYTPFFHIQFHSEEKEKYLQWINKIHVIQIKTMREFWIKTEDTVSWLKRGSEMSVNLGFKWLRIREALIVNVSASLGINAADILPQAGGRQRHGRTYGRPFRATAEAICQLTSRAHPPRFNATTRKHRAHRNLCLSASSKFRNYGTCSAVRAMLRARLRARTILRTLIDYVLWQL